MPLHIKFVFAVTLAAFLLTGAFAFSESRNLANRSNGFKQGFAFSAGLFGMVTIINTRHALCPPWVAARWLKLQIIVLPAFAIEMVLLGIISLPYR